MCDEQDDSIMAELRAMFCDPETFPYRERARYFRKWAMDPTTPPDIQREMWARAHEEEEKASKAGEYAEE